MQLDACRLRLGIGGDARGRCDGHGRQAGKPALRRLAARAIRAQANAIEYIPLLLVMLLIAENNGAGVAFVHACGAGLVLARVLHAVGLSSSAGVSLGRFWGILLTWAVLLALGLQLIWGYIAALSAA